MSRSNIESLTVMLGKNQAHYLKAGSGTPVILIHGGASDSRDWLGTMSALDASYSLYAPDLIGYGRSDRTKSGYYLSDFVEFVMGFIQSLNLGSPVLVGHSLGGRVCLEVSLRYPEKVSKLVLIDVSGLGEVSKIGTIMQTAFWAIRKVLRKRQPYPVILPEDGEGIHWICRNELTGLKTPTLIVWKRYDPYFPLSLALKAKRLIPDVSLVVVPGYGHAPHKQDVDVFNGILRNFLDGS